VGLWDKLLLVYGDQSCEDGFQWDYGIKLLLVYGDQSCEDRFQWDYGIKLLTL